MRYQEKISWLIWKKLIHQIRLKSFSFFKFFIINQDKDPSSTMEKYL
jgi:hypothetical protein